MLKKLFITFVIFIITFAIISISADIYYHGRLTYHPDSDGKERLCASDFRVFWTAARNMRSTEGIVYDKSEAFYHFRYSPFGALVMVPYGLIAYAPLALNVWFITLNVAMLLALLLLVNQLSAGFNISRGQKYIILWTTLIVSLRFYFMSLAVGQIDVIIALLFVFFLLAYVRDKELLSGIILALILQFKPLFLPALFYFLIAGKKKLVISTIIAFFLFLIAPVFVVGFERTATLLKNWVAILEISVPSQLLNYKNQSVTYFVGKLLLKDATLQKLISVKDLFYILGGALTLSAYILMLRFKRSVVRRDADKYKYVEVSGIILTTLLFSPIAWVAHFINLIIPFSVTILFVLNSKKKKALYWSLGAFFLLSWVIGTDFTNFIPYVNKIHFINIALGTIFLTYALFSSYRQNAT